MIDNRGWRNLCAGTWYEPAPRSKRHEMGNEDDATDVDKPAFDGSLLVNC